MYKRQTIDRDLCTGCFKCIDVCYAESKRIAGREYTVEELYHEIQKDKSFYSRYGGGVTFSGGEPLTHGAYLARIAKKCRDHKIHVMVESCGYARYEEFEEALDVYKRQEQHRGVSRSKAVEHPVKSVEGLVFQIDFCFVIRQVIHCIIHRAGTPPGTDLSGPGPRWRSR